MANNTAWAGFVCVLTLIVGPAAAQVDFDLKHDAVVIRVDGKEFSTLQFGQARNKPYLHPLRTASGKAVTRGYPDDPQPNELHTIPHQVGLWVGHEKTSGVDYFEVDPSYDNRHRRGKVAFKDVTAMNGGAERGVLSFVAEWVHPAGRVVLQQDETLTFYSEPRNCRMVDVTFVLRPKERLTFADHNDGILGLRLGAPFEERKGGKVSIFTGVQGADEVIGKRSPWLEYEATLDGEKVGVLIMDHPGNYNFPTRWKVRPFASIFASAFGEKEFYEETEAPFDRFHGVPPNGVKDMGITLDRDETMTFRYRVLIHPIPFDFNAAWLDFVRPAATNPRAGAGSQ